MMFLQRFSSLLHYYHEPPIEKNFDKKLLNSLSFFLSFTILFFETVKRFKYQEHLSTNNSLLLAIGILFLVAKLYISFSTSFFKILFDNQGSTIMFHCTAGKDRTGFASALILTLFGVENTTIIDDYLLSNKTYKPTQKVEGEVEKIGIKELLKVDRSWLNAGMKEFSERVGNIKDFCTKIIRSENRLREYLDYCQNSGE